MAASKRTITVEDVLVGQQIHDEDPTVVAIVPSQTTLGVGYSIRRRDADGALSCPCKWGQFHSPNEPCLHARLAIAALIRVEKAWADSADENHEIITRIVFSRPDGVTQLVTGIPVALKDLQIADVRDMHAAEEFLSRILGMSVRIDTATEDEAYGQKPN